jgi:hypothetical protein
MQMVGYKWLFENKVDRAGMTVYNIQVPLLDVKHGNVSH